MDDYHLLNQIGEGSFGRVYKARRKYTGRLVAIKMINKLGQSKEDLASFRSEIDILKKVNHPNIMNLLEIFETQTDFCLVTELGRGDLFLIINDNQTLPEDQLKNVAAQLVSALCYLHSKRVIHRDLKPQNVLISYNGTLKLCDFGFARALSNTTLVLNSIKGTPLYMAPELVQQQQYNEKVDVWSLGVILYELYYGKTPFFTNSLYSLIQMIVNDEITWPGPISAEYKEFLNAMLQKNPERRLSASELLKLKFIKDVDLTMYDDSFYRYKKEQFEEAIHESFSKSAVSPFQPPKTKGIDFQSVFVNPMAHSAAELQAAAKHLIESDVSPDSPLAASFAFHFKEFIANDIVVEEALKAAAFLLQKDREKYLNSFNAGFRVLGQPDMPKSSIEFFTQALLLPHAVRVFSLGEPYTLDLNQQKAEKLKDRLLSFLFTPDAVEVMKTYALMSFLSQASDEFLAVMAGSFSSQVIPIITSHVTHNQSAVVAACGFSVLAKIVKRNPSSAAFIQPAGEFFTALETVLSQPPADIYQLCLYSAAFAFLEMNFASVTPIAECQRLVKSKDAFKLFKLFMTDFYESRGGTARILQALLKSAAMRPDTAEEYLSYVSLLESPFAEFPIGSSDLASCVAALDSLLDVHQPALLAGVTSLPDNEVVPHFAQFVPLFSSRNCVPRIAEFSLRLLSLGYEEVLKAMKKGGVMNALVSAVEDFGRETPFHLKALLCRLVLAYKKATPAMLERAGPMLTALYSLEVFAEAGAMITAHLARIDARFLPVIEASGGLKFAEFMVKNRSGPVRARALSFVGHFARWRPLPEEYLQRVLPSLIKNFTEEDVECRRFAAFALGNVVFQTPSAAGPVAAEFDAISAALGCGDSETVAHTAALVCNIIRPSDQFLHGLIEANIVLKVLQTLEARDDLACFVLMRIPVLCKHEEGRKYLQNRGIRPLIAKMAGVKNQQVSELAQRIISLIGA